MECLYPSNNYLHHNFDSGVCIAPGKYYEMTFTFYPREAKKYSETITFEVNGLSRQSVQVNGTGTEMKVWLRIKYSEMITFEVNGLSRQSVQVNGTGTEMKV